VHAEHRLAGRPGDRLAGLQRHEQRADQAGAGGDGDRVDAIEAAADVRQRGARLIEENRAHVEAAGLIVDGTGFWASAVRSVMTASFALARQPYPSRCFATGLDAGTWFATFPAGQGLEPAQVASALAQLSTAA